MVEVINYYTFWQANSMDEVFEDFVKTDGPWTPATIRRKDAHYHVI